LKKSLLNLLIVIASILSLPANAAIAEAVDAYDKGDYVAAEAEFRKLAESGNARAQYRLARMYFLGLGVVADVYKSIELRGIAVSGNAFVLFRQDALQGNLDGQFFLSEMLRLGDGIERNENEAIIWIRKAADRGHVDAQNSLGARYSRGEGIKQDSYEAITWFQKAANQGFVVAQTNLVYTFLRLGGPANDQEALKWAFKTAEAGYYKGEAALGLLYQMGRGVDRDYGVAAFWLRKSAYKGDSQSQVTLGDFYTNGHGVEKNDMEAYFWFLIAREGGKASQWDIDKQGARLSEADKAAVELQAKLWKPVYAESEFNRTIKPPPSGGVRKPLELESTGSGWYVSKDKVVTNAHVVSGCTSIKVDGRLQASTVAINAQDDLAVLKVPIGKSNATLRSSILRQGEPITVVGFPLRGVLATGINVTAGNVSALAGLLDDPRFIQITAPVQPGNSGGPMLDSSGNVAGVIVSKLNAVKIARATGDIPQNVNFAISLATLQRFLDSNSIDFKTAVSNKIMSTPDVAIIAKKFTVLIECYK
jgi:uncharacterized protein